MPRKAKKFPRLTAARAIRATRWAVGLLGLEDYHNNTAVWIQDDPPRWCGAVGDMENGQAHVVVSRKRARIWVSPSRVDEGEDPLEVVLHEVVHVLFQDAGIRRDAGDTHVHGVVYRLGKVLAAAYRAKVKV